MQDELGVLTKSGLIKSIGVSFVIGTLAALLYSYIERVPVYAEVVWAVFFTGMGVTFIVCMAAMVVYSQMDHTPHHHNHSH